MLIPDWQKVARKSWSIWASTAAAIFSGIAMIWFVLYDNMNERLFILGGIVCPVMAVILRLVAQPGLTKGLDNDD